MQVVPFKGFSNYACPFAFLADRLETAGRPGAGPGPTANPGRLSDGERVAVEGECGERGERRSGSSRMTRVGWLRWGCFCMNHDVNVVRGFESDLRMLETMSSCEMLMGCKNQSSDFGE